jgi:hypothetical protein
MTKAEAITNEDYTLETDLTSLDPIDAVVCHVCGFEGKVCRVIDSDHVSYGCSVFARERTCHPISASEAFPDKLPEWWSAMVLDNHAFPILSFCSECHDMLGNPVLLPNYCSGCGAKVIEND